MSRLKKYSMVDLSDGIREINCYPYIALCNKRTGVANISIDNEFVEKLDKQIVDEIIILLEKLADKIHRKQMNEQTYHFILNELQLINEELKAKNMLYYQMSVDAK